MAKNFDLFISHASEDKDFVLPLSEALRNRGISIWLSEAQIHPGDNIKHKIEDGLSHSSFALVVLSSDFLTKHRSRQELNAALSVERDRGTLRILPIWHKVTAKEVAQFSPLLADRIAISTELGIDRVTQLITSTVSQNRDIRRAKCLVLAPQAVSYSAVYRSISQALAEAGVEAFRLDQQPSTASIAETFTEVIRSSDFIVADVSEASPNLFFEIGMVYALDKPIIILANNQSETRLPFDLSGYRTVSYDSSDLDSLVPSLRRIARRYADSQGLGR